MVWMTAEISDPTLLMIAFWSAVGSASAERTLLSRLALAEARAEGSTLMIADKTDAAYWESPWAEARAANAAKWLRIKVEGVYMAGCSRVRVDVGKKKRMGND
jgi:hypothetical protein